MRLIFTIEEREAMEHAINGINLTLLMMAVVARTLPDFLDAKLGELPNVEGH